MGVHGRGIRGLESERDDFVVKGGEDGLVVALDHHQRAHHALKQERLVVEQPRLQRTKNYPPSARNGYHETMLNHDVGVHGGSRV